MSSNYLKVSGARDPLWRAVLLPTSWIQEEGPRGLLLLLLCLLLSLTSWKQEKRPFLISIHCIIQWLVSIATIILFKTLFVITGAPGLFFCEQHQWWGVQCFWPLSMGLLWTWHSIPGTIFGCQHHHHRYQDEPASSSMHQGVGQLIAQPDDLSYSYLDFYIDHPR